MWTCGCIHWHCCPVVALILVVTASGGAGAVAHTLSSWCRCCHVSAIPLSWPWHAMGAVTHTSASLSSPHHGRRCCGADTVLPSSLSHASHLIGVDGTAGGDVIVVMCITMCQLDRAMGGTSLLLHMSQRANWRVAVARAWCQCGAVIIVIARVIMVPKHRGQLLQTVLYFVHRVHALLVQTDSVTSVLHNLE